MAHSAASTPVDEAYASDHGASSSEVGLPVGCGADGASDGAGVGAAGRADGPGVANADGAAVGSRVGSAEGRSVGLSVLSQHPKCPMLPSARMPGQHCPVSCIALQRGCA